MAGSRCGDQGRQLTLNSKALGQHVLRNGLDLILLRVKIMVEDIDLRRLTVKILAFKTGECIGEYI